MSQAQVFAVAIDDAIDDGVLAAVIAAAPAPRREAIGRLRAPDDIRRSVLGDALVRGLAADRFGVAAGSLRCADGPHGKPVLSGHAGFEFNVSHSGRFVLAGVADDPIGVDVQRIDARRDLAAVLALARTAFAPEEQRALAAAGDPRLFYRLWTLRESYLKYVGTGLTMPRDAFWFTSEAPGWVLHLADGASVPETMRPRFVTIDLDPDHPAAVCTVADRVAPVRRLRATDVLSRVISVV